jgi:hypothetical protein
VQSETETCGRVAFVHAHRSSSSRFGKKQKGGRIELVIDSLEGEETNA